MATTDDARHQSESARQRMNEIAQELARRTTPEQLKALAREKGGELKDLARHKADEMMTDARHSAREKVTELKDSAVHQAREKVADLKESAVHQGEELKERAGRHPALLGGLIGSAVGIGAGLIARRMADRRQSEWSYPARRTYTPEYGYQPAVYPAEGGRFTDAEIDTGDKPTGDKLKETGEKLRENVSDKFESAKESVSGRVESAKENVSGKFESAKERMDHARENLRQHIPSTGEIKERTRHYAEASGEHPWILAAVGFGLGMFASRLIPETDIERQKLGDVKHRAAERLSEFGKDIEQKVSGESAEEERFDSEALTTGAMNEPIETYEPGSSLH